MVVVVNAGFGGRGGRRCVRVDTGLVEVSQLCRATSFGPEIRLGLEPAPSNYPQ